MKHIYKCTNCNKYTMKETCECGSATLAPRPLKYDPIDRLGSYRRKAKKDEYIKRELI
ncbi:MAG: nucleolar RNA-binding Nop10p family protein [Nanoarchaeota archaeon]